MFFSIMTLWSKFFFEGGSEIHGGSETHGPLREIESMIHACFASAPFGNVIYDFKNIGV